MSMLRTSLVNFSSRKINYAPVLFKRNFSSIWRIPSFQNLSPFWIDFFNSADLAINENFWGSLATLKKAFLHQDPHAKHLTEIGSCFDEGKETPASFYQVTIWA